MSCKRMSGCKKKNGFEIIASCQSLSRTFLMVTLLNIFGVIIAVSMTKDFVFKFSIMFMTEYI